MSTNRLNSKTLRTHTKIYTSVKANGRLLDDVCKMGYDGYLANKTIEENHTKRFFDHFDHQSNCQSYLTYCDGEVVGSIRACVYKPENEECVPAIENYESDIAREIGFRNPFVESDMFVIAPSFQRRTGSHARFALVRNMVNSAIINDVKIIVVAVRPELVRLYKSFSFAPISSSKQHPDLSCKMILLACYDIMVLSTLINRKIPQRK